MTEMHRLLGAGLLSLLLTLVLGWVWLRVAPRIGAVDRPRGRHRHKTPTPTIGGIAIYVSVWASLIALLGWPLPDAFTGLLIASSLLVALNVWDDVRGLPPAGRLAVQFAVAAVAYAWGVRIEGIGNLFGLLGMDVWVNLGWLSAPATVLWIVFITNALNWLDGLDGLAAGVAGISAAGLAAMAAMSTGHFLFPAIAAAAAAICGACLGFLKYNFYPARMFMGDTGAMFLGFMLSCISVMGAFKFPTAGAIVLPMLLLGVPLFDSTTAIVKRIANGKNPLEGDRTHIHYRLLDSGLSVPQTALVIYAFSGLLCAAALWLWSR